MQQLEWNRLKKVVVEMKIKREKIAALLLAAELAGFCTGCAGDKSNAENVSSDVTIESTETPSPEPTHYNIREVSDEDMYIIESNYHTIFYEYLNAEYEELEPADYTLYPKADIIFKGEDDKIESTTVSEDFMRVRALETNGEYTKVLLPDGREGYVSNYELVKCVDVNGNEYYAVEEVDKVVNTDCYLYDEEGMYSGYCAPGIPCTAIATNDEYTTVIFDKEVKGITIDWLQDGKPRYIPNDCLSSGKCIVDDKCPLEYDAPIYLDKELTEPISTFKGENEKIYVFFAEDGYALVGDPDYREIFYVDSADLTLEKDNEDAKVLVK